MGVDVLLVGLGSTAGLRAAEDELAAALGRGGASVALQRAKAPREVRTLMLTDLLWARAARAAALAGIERHEPRAIVYSTITAALLWPRPGAIRYDALGSENRPGRHGLWQRPLERRRLAAASLLIPQAGATQDRTVVVPIAVAASGPPGASRDVAVLSYAANPQKKGIDRLAAAWEAAAGPGEELVLAGERPELIAPIAQSRVAGALPATEYRALLRRARVYATAPRREDYGVAQLEALADGAQLVTTSAPGPYVALELARRLDPRLVVEDPDDTAALARALRTALDDPSPGYAERAAELIAPFAPAAVDAVVAERLLPLLLG